MSEKVNMKKKYILFKKYGQNTSNYKFFKSGLEIKFKGNKKDCIKTMKDLAFKEHNPPYEETEDYIIFGDYDLIIEEA